MIILSCISIFSISFGCIVKLYCVNDLRQERHSFNFRNDIGLNLKLRTP